MKFQTIILTTLATLFLVACSDIKQDELLQSAVDTDNAPMLASYNSKGTIEDQYIIVFKEDAFEDEEGLKAELEYEAGIAAMEQVARKVLNEDEVPADRLRKVYHKALKGMVAKLSPEEKERIANDPRVDFIEQDQIFQMNLQPGRRFYGTPRTPLTPSTGPLATSQVTEYGINRIRGGNEKAKKKEKCWVIDTGIDLDHPDLNVDQGKSANFCTQGTYSSDGNDGHGHGTHVAGIIGAKDNNLGTIGVAPDAKLVAIKVLSDEGMGTYSDAIAGINYVKSHADKKDVVNMSFGGAGSWALDLAVMTLASGKNAPHVFIAAGNWGGNTACTKSPGRAFGSKIHTVTAVDNNDHLCFFSSYGSCVDFAMPGWDIMSTYKDGAYMRLTGTSMAAPHAAGIFMIDKYDYDDDGYAIGDPYQTDIIVYDD